MTRRRPRALPTPLLDATEAAIAGAAHLKGEAAKPFAGAMEAARALARKIDAWDVIVEWALEDAYDGERGARPSVPQNDNVSLASYLKYMEALGLTPAAQAAIPRKDGGAPAKRGGKLASVSDIPRPNGTTGR